MCLFTMHCMFYSRVGRISVVFACEHVCGVHAAAMVTTNTSGPERIYTPLLTLNGIKAVV